MLSIILFLGAYQGTGAQEPTLPMPTAPPQVFIVITPTPEVWPTQTPEPTETLTPTETPEYADLVAYATVQYGEDDTGRLTAFRYEMTAGDRLNAVLLGIIAGLLLLDVLLRIADWRKRS